MKDRQLRQQQGDIEVKDRQLRQQQGDIEVKDRQLRQLQKEIEGKNIEILVDTICAEVSHSNLLFLRPTNLLHFGLAVSISHD